MRYLKSTGKSVRQNTVSNVPRVNHSRDAKRLLVPPLALLGCDLRLPPCLSTKRRLSELQAPWAGSGPQTAPRTAK